VHELDQLTITEIYASIQGESAYAGIPCTFIRLTGCPLRCRWCDTAYAFKGGAAWTVRAVVDEVKRLGVQLVELTGGEPLAQAGTPELARQLVGAGFQLLCETSGSEDVGTLPLETHIIMDWKCPDSGMTPKNLVANFERLKPSDEIKFVVASRSDFDWALEEVRKYQLDTRFHVLFSCAWGHVAPKDLAAWILERPIRCRMQLQQHKYIWGPRAKGV
jgi:7-carboxy-7-deazaguanine synthase